MFENILKEYLPRAFAMQGEQDLMLTWVTGWFLLGLFCIVMSSLVLYLKSTGGRGTTMFRPLGIWFAMLAIVSGGQIASIWYNLLWLQTICVLLVGLVSIWAGVSIPQAIKERRELRDCDSLRQDYNRLQRDLEIQRGIIDNYLNHRNVNPDSA